MLAGSFPYRHTSAISGGPIPPPPRAWQPTQLFHSYSRCPSVCAYPLSSYGFRIDAPADPRAPATAFTGALSWSGRLLPSHPASKISRTPQTRASGARRDGLRKGEHIEHASLARRLGQVPHRVGEAEGRGSVARIDVGRDRQPRPPSDARQHRDVLLAVGSEVRDGLTDDSRLRLELPDQIAGARVDRFEPAVHRSVKDQVARRGQRAAAGGKLFFAAPDFCARDWIPGGEGAAIRSAVAVHLHIRADERGPLDVVRLDGFHFLAEVVLRDVEQEERKRGVE